MFSFYLNMLVISCIGGVYSNLLVLDPDLLDSVNDGSELCTIESLTTRRISLARDIRDICSHAKKFIESNTISFYIVW